MQDAYFEHLAHNVATALAEDRSDYDITAELIPKHHEAKARVITRQSAIICGAPWVNEVFRQVDPDLNVTWAVSDGDQVSKDQLLFSVEGSARSLLTAERTALNFLQILSGTATRTHHYVKLLEHTNAGLLDTRKTIPGLRRAQKYAVVCGGGHNHRMDLNEAFLIKENHITACGSIGGAIASARDSHPNKRIEVEVENLDEFREATAADPDWIMLDNFPLSELEQAVKALDKDIKLEASGGIEDESELVAIAETGVHYISVGALTKHCLAVDLSMRLV